MSFNSVQEIIQDIQQGKIVIIVDDEGRENEGDLLMAASMVRPEDINFMAKFGRGLICLTLTQERCKQLNLPLMVDGTQERHATNFTISIEAREGVTTGISAYDRAHTVRTAVSPNAKAEDLRQPGHVFPLMAQPGGVLMRAGHTEAGCDLARLADLEPAAVIVEILNEDGSMARRPDLEIFAERHELKVASIEALIKYRIENEKSINRITECPFATEFGEFRLIAYEDNIDHHVHLALLMGAIQADEPCLVRVHLENVLCDVLQSTSKSCGWPLRDALSRIAQEGKGVAVLLGQANRPKELIQQIRTVNFSTDPTQDQIPRTPTDLRTYGIGAQILADVGVGKMKVLSAPKRFHGLGGFGLQITEYIWE